MREGRHEIDERIDERRTNMKEMRGLMREGRHEIDERIDERRTT
jgi:hypothetical protein